MFYPHTYKVKIDLAGLEASLTGKARQKNIPVHHTYKVQKNLAGLEPKSTKQTVNHSYKVLQTL